MMSDRRVEHRVVSIYDLIPHERNYNKHSQAQLESLKASLRRFGQVDDAIVKALPQNKYKIVAHEGVTTAALQLLETGECPHLAQWGITIVPDHWTETDVVGYMATSNETARLSDPDQELLAALLQEQQDAGFDLEALGSSDESLREMLKSLGDAYVGSDEEEDEAGDELPEGVETRAKVGDVWQLGRHRIACLNSCDPEQVRRFIGDAAVSFVWADPPYGISIVATNVSVGGGEAYGIPFGGVKNRGDVGGSASHIRKTGKPYIATKGLGSSDRAKPFGSNVNKGSIGAPNPPGSKNNLRIAPKIDVGKYAPVIGDDTTATAITAYCLCAEMFPQALHVWWGANYYADALPPSKCWIVWDKENTGNFADAELAWCNHDSVVRIFRHMWNGLMKDSEKGQRRVHPTQKPIALAEWCFEKYGKEQDIIFDPFLGSGMSVIAAENLNRTVYGCELSPEYIDVIITRWEQHTGQTAQLLERIEEGPCA
jgi:hypothetical protein